MRKADNLPVPLSRNLGTFLEPSRPLQACNGTEFFCVLTDVKNVGTLRMFDKRMTVFISGLVD